MNAQHALFVLEQVKRVGLDDRMPQTLFLTRDGKGGDDYVVCGTFADGEDMDFCTIEKTQFSWKLGEITLMFEEDTPHDIMREKGLTVLAQAV